MRQVIFPLRLLTDEPGHTRCRRSSLFSSGIVGVVAAELVLLDPVPRVYRRRDAPSDIPEGTFSRGRVYRPLPDCLA